MKKFRKIYSKEFALNVMHTICDEYNIQLKFYSKRDGRGGFNYGSSAKDEIDLAPFNCKNPLERQLISFFHEFAHIRLSNQIPFNLRGYAVNNTSKMQYEFWISMIGLKFAKEHCNIVFSDDAVSWLLRQALTYKNSEESGELSKLIYGSRNKFEIEYQWI